MTADGFIDSDVMPAVDLIDSNVIVAVQATLAAYVGNCALA